MSEYRLINLNEWRKTGEGNNASSYVNDDESLMLKVFKKNATDETARRDYDMASTVASLGIKTAAVHEIVQYGEGFGVIYQNIKNKKSYSRLCADNPEDVAYYAHEFAKKAKALHQMQCKPGVFNSRTNELRISIQKAKFIKKYKAELNKIVDKMDGYTTCIHGDLQMGNLIKADGVDYWIDLDRFSYGDPKLDIAHLYNMCICCSDMKLIQDLTHMTQKQLQDFWDAFVLEYYGYTKEESTKLCKELEVYNALDLLTNNYRRPGLYSDLITLIMVKPKLKKCFEAR